MKALFFLRHYNDIDHFTPVIHKWIQCGHTCDVVLLGASHFRKDFRIAFLAGLEGVRFCSIDEILSRAELVGMRAQMMLLNRYFKGFAGPVAGAMRRVWHEGLRRRLWRRIARRLLARSFPAGGGGVVAFDWISRNSVFPVELVQDVVALAHEMGLCCVSLPHGDSPHATKLVRTDELEIAPNPKFSAASMFDRVVVPNELCAGRFRPFLEPDQLAILGSPRYSDEWLERYGTLLPPSPLEAAPQKFKLVLFLRKSEFSIFWSEVERIVPMIAAFEGAQVIIKKHTRGGIWQPLSRNHKVRRLSNVRFVGDEVHSPHLLAWADVVIDLATSVVFEAVKMRKPVLAADYLHASISTVAAYMPETAVHSRDELYVKLRDLGRHGSEGFFDEENRRRFLEEVLDVPDADVLPRFVALLEELAGSDPKPAASAGPRGTNARDASHPLENSDRLSDKETALRCKSV